MAGSVMISKDVEIESYMEDFSTDDLLEELLERDCPSLDIVLEWLDKLKLPKELTAPIRDYFDQPAADLAAWDRWMEFANA